MTHALRELMDIDSGHIDDPENLDRLAGEVRTTAEAIRTHEEEDPQDITDVIAAGEHLKKDLGLIGLRGLFALMEAAAVTGNSGLIDDANQALDAQFPVEGVNDLGLLQVNIESRAQFKQALEVSMEDKEVSFGRALSRAEAKTDEEAKRDFDAVIVASHGVMKARRRFAKHDIEMARQEEEYSQLRAKGTADNRPTDETGVSTYDPFADDDEEDEVKVKVRVA